MANRDEPTEIDAGREMVLSFLDRFQTNFPAICVSDEGPDNRVTVQPAIRINTKGGKKITPSPVTIPVEWWSFGDIVIQGKLKAGDEVTVRCLDRNWLGWLATGGVVDGTAPGGHQAGYAVAVPAQLSKTKRPGPTDVLRIGRKDGTATVTIAINGTGKVTIQAPEIELGSAALTKLPLSRDTDPVNTNAAFTTWRTNVEAGVAAGGGGAVPPLVGTEIGTVSASSTEVIST